MKILHLISQHPEGTGSGYYLQNIIRQAIGAGHENFLVAGLSDGYTPDLTCIDRQHCRFVLFRRGLLNYAIPGMSDVMPYPSSRFGTLSPAQLDSYEKVFGAVVQQAVHDFAPDIIHSHHLWLMSAVTRKLMPFMPMVTSCHSTDLRQLLQCPQLRERVLPHCRNIDRILALNHDQADRIVRLYQVAPQRIAIVGGGYDETLFTRQSKDSSLPVQLLYGGKLSFAKGIDVLLRAFLSVKTAGVHLHLAGSGTGAEAETCLALAAAGDAVTVHGRISQQELAGLMGRCHIFILPSFYEGLPLVLLEALASGCRIITTNLPGCRELLGGAGPDLVEFIKLPAMRQLDRPEPKDLPAIERALRQAIDSMVARTLASPSPDWADIRKITARFGWKAVFEKINRAYDRAISG